MATTTQTKKRKTTKPEAPEAQDSSLMPPTTENSSVMPPQNYNPNESIELPSFDTHSWKPSNLQTDSSGVTRTTSADTAEVLLSIKERRNTLSIVRANIGLMSDLVKSATDYRKLEGLVIDYNTVGIDNQTKQVRQNIAQVRLDREGVKLDGERHLIDQERIKTEGIGSLTPVVQDEWNQRKEIALARVEALKRSAESLRMTYEETRDALGV